MLSSVSAGPEALSVCPSSGPDDPANTAAAEGVQEGQAATLS